MTSVQPIGTTITERIEASTPNIVTQVYLRMQERWTKCRDVFIGTEAIREGAETYLPQYENESDEMYAVRRDIAAFYNGYGRTVLAAVGLLLQSEPALAQDMPEELKQMWENVDGAGTHGAVFTKRLAISGMTDAIAGILTEYPRASDRQISKGSKASAAALDSTQPLDAADEQALGLKPYFIMVKADQIILPLYETINDKRVLTMLIVSENVTERLGEFGYQRSLGYRVYRLKGSSVTYECWSGASGSPVRTEGPTTMQNIDQIPWSPFIAGDEIGTSGSGEYKPPLMDLADLNISHHRQNTGILSLEELAFVPTLVRIGANPDKDGKYPPILLGPGNTIEAPFSPQGVNQPVYWLSPSVDVLAQAQTSLENCKAEMGAMGASFLVPQQQKAQETATAHRLDSTAEQSTVATVGRALQDCLESAFGYAGQYIKKPGGSVGINREFEHLTMDGRMIMAWAALVEAGFDKLEVLKTFQAAGMLSPDADIEDLAKKWEDNVAAKEAKAAQDAADKLALMKKNGAGDGPPTKPALMQ